MDLLYADAILSKKGPLARVWLAAHYERKLSKAQTLQTDIGQSAKAIESRPLALRISGQLLLGVCRIYSRKAKYLLDDCNEALVKIKMAFRPGVVDMTDEQLAVPANAITLQGDGFNLDLFGDTWDFDQSRQTGGRHLAREADINLPMQEDFIMTIDGGGDWGLDMDGGFGDLDLNFGEPSNDLDEDSMAVEVARDAAPARSARESMASALNINKPDLDNTSVHTGDGGDFVGMDIDIGDLGDLGLGFEDMFGEVNEPNETAEPEGGSHASTPLTEPGPTTPVDEPAEETPRKKKEKRKAKEKKQVIDAVTELNDGNDRRKANQNGLPFAKADVSNIITPPVYLPSSSMVMRYLEVRADPLSHFFPIKVTDTGSFYCVAPPGIAPEISDMFLFPAPQGAGQKRKGPGQDERATKRQRLGSEPIDEVEMPRLRAGSAALSAAGNFNEDHFGDGFAEESGFFPNDDTLPLDNVRFDVDDSLHLDKPPSSRHTTPGADLFDENVRVYADVDSLVAIFDTQPQTQDTTGPTSSQQPADDKEETTNKDGFGRNTLKAIGLLRNEFDALGSRKNKNLSFAQLTDKGSRRAASSFFFELLLLGTRDCVKLSQVKAFDDIVIGAKDKLQEIQLQQDDL